MPCSRKELCPIWAPESGVWAEEEEDQGCLTSAEDDALVGDLVLGLEAGAVPALVPELVLALVDGDLDALDGRGRHVGVAHAHLQLPPRQPRQRQAHRVGVQHRLRRQLQAQDLIGAGALGGKRKAVSPADAAEAGKPSGSIPAAGRSVSPGGEREEAEGPSFSQQLSWEFRSSAPC